MSTVKTYDSNLDGKTYFVPDTFLRVCAFHYSIGDENKSVTSTAIRHTYLREFAENRFLIIQAKRVHPKEDLWSVTTRLVSVVEYDIEVHSDQTEKSFNYYKDQ